MTVEPPHLFVFLWDAEVIRIELAREAGETVVVLTDGRWSARFDRQLTCPADVAWELLAPSEDERFRCGVDSAAGERVHVEVVPGSGHGARLVLTVSGTDPARRDDAVARGAGTVERVARDAAAWAHRAVGPELSR